jgi:hypothetical protein
LPFLMCGDSVRRSFLGGHPISLYLLRSGGVH